MAREGKNVRTERSKADTTPVRTHLAAFFPSASAVASVNCENGAPRLEGTRRKLVSRETCPVRSQRLNQSLATTTKAEPDNCPFLHFDGNCEATQVSKKYASKSGNATQASRRKRPIGWCCASNLRFTMSSSPAKAGDPVTTRLRFGHGFSSS